MMKSNAYIWIVLLFCMGIGGVVLLLNFLGILTSGYEIVPHLITVASVVLGMVTLTLTIMMAIKDGTAYQMAKSRSPELLQQIYGYASSALISGIITIIGAITTLTTKHLVIQFPFYKGICIWGLATAFSFMIGTVSMSYLQSIQLLRFDDEV